jgi:hypothetical protein
MTASRSDQVGHIKRHRGPSARSSNLDDERRQRRDDAKEALDRLDHYTREVLRYGRDAIGLPDKALILLQAAIRGEAVDEAAFARALTLTRDLAQKLGWQGLACLREVIKSGRP